MSNSYEIEQILSKLLVQETVDGLLFWGPKLLLSTDMNNYDEVFLCIEGTCTMTEQDRVTSARKILAIDARNVVAKQWLKERK